MSQTAATPPPGVFTREAYLAWYEAQPRGRYERVEGRIHPMAPERGAHLRAKALVWLALRRAIAASGLPCEALPDGGTVAIGDGTDYEPDATVTWGERMAHDATLVPSPVIVVEVLSPSTRSVDTGAKLADYFRVPSIHHYLLVRTDRQAVVHHRRRGDGTDGIDTRLVAAGEIALDPPGLRVAVEEFYAD